MEPYTKQQALNYLKSVRRRVPDLFSQVLTAGGLFASLAFRPHARWLPDWRGSHHSGLQSPSVSSPTQCPNERWQKKKKKNHIFAVCRNHVIHAVGPVYHPKSKRAPLQLAGCYRISLELAVQHGLKHIVSMPEPDAALASPRSARYSPCSCPCFQAFPAISTGIYSYPAVSATRVALGEVRKFLDTDEAKEVRLVFFFVSRRSPTT